MRVEGGIVRRGSRPCLTTHLHALDPLTNTAEMSKEFSGQPITIASQNGVYSSMLLRMSSHNKPPRKQSSILFPVSSSTHHPSNHCTHHYFRPTDTESDIHSFKSGHCLAVT